MKALVLSVAIVLGLGIASGTASATPSASAGCADQLEGCSVCVRGVHPWFDACAQFERVIDPGPCTCDPQPAPF
ncbi:MAG: hypothetical protein ACT4PT_13405 [Methanobacteriota archaeon]